MRTYRYIEDSATADIAFEASGDTLEETFMAACDATINVMIENPESIRSLQKRELMLRNDELDMLLFNLLQELIYYKDAQQLMLRIEKIKIEIRNGTNIVTAVAAGEKLDPKRHDQRTDVKAVTLHQFALEQTDAGWTALVILDV